MIDVVHDLELDDWLKHERDEACRFAARRIDCAERHVDMVRRLYNAGDEAYGRGDDELADRLWNAARTINGAPELGAGSDGTP